MRSYSLYALLTGIIFLLGMISADLSKAKEIRDKIRELIALLFWSCAFSVVLYGIQLGVVLKK